MRVFWGRAQAKRDPEMLEAHPDWPFGRWQSLILEVLDLCPILGEISGLGDFHTHPGHRDSLLFLVARPLL